MKQLVLAEKPSVGRELARVLGCWKKEKGFSEGEKYIVTWALGHLVELAQPAAYNERYRRWEMRDLPMLPPELKQEVIEQTAEQYKIVEGLLRREDVDGLVIATDAGREGELVARWIMKLAGYKGKVSRLWISSQTDAAITEGFAKLKDGSLYENLYEAAASRAAADWYVGMNVTRALTCHYDARLSAGRVQTPTLALMTNREDEIEAFAGAFYWSLRADFGLFSASWQDPANSIRIESEQRAEDIAEKVRGRDGRVSLLETQDKNEQPPLAYDLTELQRDANLYLSYSAKETLDILQRLYENHKIVTYPRTDSRYITGDIVPTLGSRLRALAGTPFGPLATRYASEGFRIDEQRFVQESQVTDHHAIIPTEQKVDLGRLSAEERALWELITMRFLEVLSPDYCYRTTVLEATVADERFVTRLTVAVSQGWRDVARLIGRRSAAPLLDSDDTEDAAALARIALDDPVKLSAVKVRRTATNPPERYTEATLLSAMEHAGRFVDDAALKKRLGGGLGTPATRADIIEKLIQNHYIEREGKYLVPTPRGRELVRLAPPQLRSPELTARWEGRLAMIAEGKESSAVFIKDIKDNAAALVKEVSSSKDKFIPRFPDGKICPWCSGPMMKAVDEFGQTHFLCQRLSCGYEEALVKRRLPSATQTEAKPVAVAAVVRAAVKSTPAAAPASVVEDGQKKKMVIVKKTPVSRKKKEAVAEEIQWETTVEVVRPSKLAYSHNRKPESAQIEASRSKLNVLKEDRPWGKTGQEQREESGGVSFADLLAASEKRKEQDRQRRKR
ncbi:MAG: DNA topoisomerase III [Spirochaetae bacterium HGW-Spirochaetae-8]|nr:MAG: DNA topoisomerase III [Spirochaetae bacterium HGW-Spirochaetae-8]